MIDRTIQTDSWVFIVFHQVKDYKDSVKIFYRNNSLFLAIYSILSNAVTGDLDYMEAPYVDCRLSLREC
jgi:hypothetical protein